jgi:hypothetical protein
MIVIFLKLQPLGKLLIERHTKVGEHQISIKRNGVQLFEDDDYYLREKENEKETTIVQIIEGQENEIVTIVRPPR